jgi:FlaG/FlaF family flagellin (archaellin)
MRRNDDGRSFRNSNRAVSNTLGFVLVFALMIMSVGVVATYGMGALEESRDFVRQSNAERALTIGGAGLNEIARGETPGRSSQIELRDGSLSLQNDTTVSVTVDGTTYTYHPRSLVYAQADGEIRYQSGAVFRVSRSGSVGQTKPLLTCGDDGAVVSVVTLRPAEGPTSVGSGSVQLSASRNRTKLSYPGSRGSDAVSDVSIEVTSPQSDAWNRLLSDLDGWSDPDGDGAYTCDASQVYVRHTIVDVWFVS